MSRAPKFHSALTVAASSAYYSLSIYFVKTLNFVAKNHCSVKEIQYSESIENTCSCVRFCCETLDKRKLFCRKYFIAVCLILCENRRYMFPKPVPDWYNNIR